MGICGWFGGWGKWVDEGGLCRDCGGGREETMPLTAGEN